jgi:hypothetical protein
MPHEFTGVKNLQFWPWRKNNCAPATFLTVTELMCVRLFEPLRTNAPDSLFATVVATRGDITGSSYVSHNSAFDRFHRKFAGVVRGGSCEIPAHLLRAKMGCCAYGHFCSYTGYLEHMYDIMDGADCRQAFLWKLRSRKLSLAHSKLALLQCHRGDNMTTEANRLLQQVVGAAPSCLHVELNHVGGHPGSLTHEKVMEAPSDWNYAPSVTLKCGSVQLNVLYVVGAVLYGDNAHWVALILDGNGGKWSYDSTQPVASPGLLLHRGTGPIRPADGVTMFGVGYTPRIVVYLLTSDDRGTQMPADFSSDSDNELTDVTGGNGSALALDGTCDTESTEGTAIIHHATSVTYDLTSPSTEPRPDNGSLKGKHMGNRDLLRSTLFVAGDTITYLMKGPCLADVRYEDGVPSVVGSITKAPNDGELARAIVQLDDGTCFVVGDVSCTIACCCKPDCARDMERVEDWSWGSKTPSTEEPYTYGAHPPIVLREGDTVTYRPQLHSSLCHYTLPTYTTGVIESIRETGAQDVFVQMEGGDILEVGCGTTAWLKYLGEEYGHVMGLDADTIPHCSYYGYRLTSQAVYDAILLRNKKKARLLMSKHSDKIRAELEPTGMAGFVKTFGSKSSSGSTSTSVAKPLLPNPSSKSTTSPSLRYLYCDNTDSSSTAWRWGSKAHVIPEAIVLPVVDAAVPQFPCDVVLRKSSCGLVCVWVHLEGSQGDATAIASLSHSMSVGGKRKFDQSPHVQASAFKAATLTDPRFGGRIPESQESQVSDRSTHDSTRRALDPTHLFPSGSEVDCTDGETSVYTETDGLDGDLSTPHARDSTIESSSSCPPRVEDYCRPCRTYPPAGTMATEIASGVHPRIMFDLTSEMVLAKPNIEWEYANAYYHNEFLHAVQLLVKRIQKMDGGEFFWKRLHYCATPGSWKHIDQPFPPLHPEKESAKKKEVREPRTVMKHFGMKYRCDHYRQSECRVFMEIRREHDKDPTKDIYSVCMSRGHHLMACNHLTTYKSNTLNRYPLLHPVIDLFLRQKVESTVSKRHPFQLSDLREDLQDHLRKMTALHCELPHAEDGYAFGKDRSLTKYKTCSHKLAYSHVSTLATYTRAADMPPTVMCNTKTGLSPRTIRRWSHIHHMCMEDGHSINGNHAFEPELEKQMKSCLATYNTILRDDHVISDSTTLESGVGPVHANFKQQNLFVRWEKMKSKDPQEQQNLSLFQWNQIGLLYRKRTDDEISIASTKRVHEDYLREDGDFPEQSDPRNLPFEFVSVYASLYSLICGVKAWACRKISGKVIVCADNMYNPLTGVPNMYWLNVGVMDAKNVHFPTVNALQLGRAAPRNEVPSRKNGADEYSVERR